ncbi:MULTISPECIES: class I SAM-dependent methyltransferase [unclassified Micromonospora]|uniref:class I SAM-dependent methyltransferase n=1 Tax=unclassified Micromonospora TaxID=2617518 RepID=UPI0005B7C773|nr:MULTISPECIES: class I SAM-dependent methyltransferase [unclassified Micromonospora]MCK1808754.1 class I SAM-dependent methyltransferase [Micromonospora sp. R42106]MCK1833336.1 class I SAM-dependent methyltransferase [Micromonospora sp. R42003]MCK1845118.1 class I SAM-dependent methyltransferase [Micromonospora sp. R42004]MCM1019118.1 class I SAM-dependent methyltransferase [Micromonospora sp. XM-20-01]RBQ04091.1 class I SAM-dependent methyltransferase [Micromonospora sp. LHW51205]
MSVFDDPGLFGRLWADTYDGPGNPDPAPAVDFLAPLAEGGPVLELAVGTGRVALPLAARGLTVEGVEASPEMVAHLRAKPGGADLPVTIGDMADVPVAGPYRLVFLVFNTLFNLVSEERQAACFRNVARVLAPGGAFVIETFVPDPADFDRDEQVQVREVTEDSATIRVHRYDRAAQTFVRQTVTFDASGVHLKPFAMRYAWPDQVDELAERAGLRLTERYADWDRSPFDADSRSHISVYRRR